MGCKQSDLREDGAPINPSNLPKVPLQSWYAEPFNEPSSMAFTPFHERNKGHVIYSKRVIPTSRAELDALGDTIMAVRQFVLGKDEIYGMGYLHNSALHIEHTWRLRVANIPTISDRPFFDMLLGVKLFINDTLVPDSCPHADSLPQCTTTYEAHEACTQWRCVPVILWPDQDSMFLKGHIYRGLIYSFLQAVVTLNNGEHTLRTEVVYGCKKENEFCTDFISRGAITLVMTDEGREKAQTMLAFDACLLEAPKERYRPIANPSERCHYCGHAKKFICNVCHAQLCLSTKCVWSNFPGYPHGCLSHPAPN